MQLLLRFLTLADSCRGLSPLSHDMVGRGFPLTVHRNRTTFPSSTWYWRLDLPSKRGGYFSAKKTRVRSLQTLINYYSGFPALLTGESSEIASKAHVSFPGIRTMSKSTYAVFRKGSYLKAHKIVFLSYLWTGCQLLLLMWELHNSCLFERWRCYFRNYWRHVVILLADFVICVLQNSLFNCLTCIVLQCVRV